MANDKKRPEIHISVNHPSVSIPGGGQAPIAKTLTGVWQPADSTLSQPERERVADAIRAWLRKQG